MAYTFYIPDAAFTAGGPFASQSKIKVKVLIGCANDTHQQMPVLPHDLSYPDNNYTLMVKNTSVVMENNLWNSLTNRGVKVQMAELVRKGCIVIDDGGGPLTPAEVLAPPP